MMRITALVVSALFLGGCVSTKPASNDLAENDPAVIALDQSAMRIARAAEQASLALSVGNKRNGVTEEYQIDLSRVPKEMRDPLLLEGGFNGQLEIFTKSIADAVGWQQPIILGSKPSVPLMVTFTEQRRPPAMWIADAGYQVGDAADVVINSALRQIVIRYKQVGTAR